MGQGGCERRIKFFVNIQKKIRGGWGVRVDVNEEFKIFVKSGGGGRGGGSGRGVGLGGSGWM